MQLVLHTKESKAQSFRSAEAHVESERGIRTGGPDRRRISVVRILQAEKVHMDHRDAALSVARPGDSSQENPANTTVQMHGGELELKKKNTQPKKKTTSITMIVLYG